jgi:hypothetical protein
MREEKANKYRELKNERGSDDWNWYFYKYSPAEERSTRKYKSTRNVKNKSKKNKKTRKRKNRFSKLPKVFGFNKSN